MTRKPSRDATQATISDEALAALARSLPSPLPARSALVRARVIAAVGHRSWAQQWSLPLVGAVAGAALATVAMAFWPTQEPPRPNRGSHPALRTIDSAERKVAASSPASVQRVAEMREVAASALATASARPAEGRIRRHPPAPLITTLAHPAPPESAPAAQDKAALRQTSEVLWVAAWQAMRAGRLDEAAAGFAAAAKSDDDSPLIEDARYWHGVALARSGHAAQARVVLGEFLDRHSGSVRAGEVHAMLGWLLVDAGDARQAEPHFEAAERDASPVVRASAVAGLAEARRGP